MQKWGKRPIYFKNAEIMQNALIMQTLRPLQVDIFILQIPFVETINTPRSKNRYYDDTLRVSKVIPCVCV